MKKLNSDEDGQRNLSMPRKARYRYFKEAKTIESHTGF